MSGWSSAGLKDLDRRTGELVVLRAGWRGPSVAFAYQQAIERAMDGSGPARLIWTAIARHRARALRRALAAR